MQLSYAVTPETYLKQIEAKASYYTCCETNYHSLE